MGDPMMDIREVLKPCPFCGDSEELRVCQPAHMHGYWVVHCGCCGGEMQAETEGGATAGWNTRAALDQPSLKEPTDAEVERLAKLNPGYRGDWEGDALSVNIRIHVRAILKALATGTAPSLKDDDVERVAKGVIDRTVERLKRLHPYAGRPCWDVIVAQELRAAIEAMSVSSCGEGGHDEA